MPGRMTLRKPYKTALKDTTDTVVCSFCHSLIKRRGLRNHHLSEYCKAHQLAITANEEGLVQLPRHAVKIFERYGLEVVRLRTGIIRTAGAHRAQNITEESWGAKVTFDVYDICRRLKAQRYKELDEEMELIRKDGMKCAQEQGDVPDDIKVQDSILRLKGSNEDGEETIT